MSPLNRAKDWVIRRLIRALSPHFQQISANTALHWWEPNHLEPTVQLVLRDLVRPGDIVFDVGANIGGLTVVLSRLVGPRGVVCAFEASPRSLADCQQNVVANGCFNVQLFQAAVFRESGREIPFYFGHHTGSDSVYPTEGQQHPALQIATLALDDFIDATGLIPKLVKMDIEGAELDALLGMQRTIVAHQPLLVIETQPDQPAALDFLRRHNYLIVDLATCQQVRSPSDFAPGCVVANVLCAPSSLFSPPYFPAVPWELVRTLKAGDLRAFADHSVESTAAIELPPGRYRVDVMMTGTGTNNEMFCGVEINGTVRFRYRGSTNLIASSYVSWIFELAQPSRHVRIFFQFLNGTTDPTFVVDQISIYCVRGGPFATVSFS